MQTLMNRADQFPSDAVVGTTHQRKLNFCFQLQLVPLHHGAQRCWAPGAGDARQCAAGVRHRARAAIALVRRAGEGGRGRAGRARRAARTDLRAELRPLPRLQCRHGGAVQVDPGLTPGWLQVDPRWSTG